MEPISGPRTYTQFRPNSPTNVTGGTDHLVLTASLHGSNRLSRFQAERLSPGSAYWQRSRTLSGGKPWTNSSLFEGWFPHFCVRAGQTGGQKATLGGRNIAFVSCSIPASCTTHIGAPPCPLHTPSMSPRLGVAGQGEDAQC